MSDARPIGFLLRESGVDSLDEMMATMGEAFDPAYGEAWTIGQCAGVFGLPGVWASFAQVDGEAAGFALTRIVLDEAELLLLGVRPSMRRLGIGQALLSRSIEMARNRGAERMHLEVRSGNSAIRLYATTGFSEIGRRSKYYRGQDGQLFDALTLSLSLADG